MATRWEVLMERVPRKQRVLFALPVASSPDRDYACPAQEAQAWKARLIAARLLTTTYRTREAAALLRKLREELKEDYSSTGLEGLVRLVEAGGEGGGWGGEGSWRWRGCEERRPPV